LFFIDAKKAFEHGATEKELRERLAAPDSGKAWNMFSREA